MLCARSHPRYKPRIAPPRVSVASPGPGVTYHGNAKEEIFGSFAAHAWWEVHGGAWRYLCVCVGGFLGEAGCYASCSTRDSPAAARSAHGRGSAAALTSRSTPSALSRERQVVEACFRSPVGSCRVTLCVDRGQVARLTRERAVSKEQRAGHLTNAHLAGDSERKATGRVASPSACSVLPLTNYEVLPQTTILERAECVRPPGGGGGVLGPRELTPCPRFQCPRPCPGRRWKR